MADEPATTTREPREVALKLDWSAAQELTILHADQLLLTYRGEYFVLSFGQVAEPAIHPADTEALDRLQESGRLAIKPLLRIAVPRKKMIEWAQIISRHVQRFAEEDGGSADDSS